MLRKQSVFDEKYLRKSRFVELNKGIWSSGLLKIRRLFCVSGFFFGENPKIILTKPSPKAKAIRKKTRFAKFFNLPELTSMFKDIVDIKTAESLNLPVPEAHYHTVVTPASDLQKDMVNGLADRAAAIRLRKVDSRIDNMLNVTNDGRKLALDQRIMNDMLPDDENSKVNACVKNVFKTWNDTAENKSTQMIFCDLSTPHYDGSFNVYDDIKNKLIDNGVPAEEIAFIHDCKTDAQKQALFEKVNSGKVRVLLGSTGKMGTGTNCQQKLIAVHHLDCPWRPSDLEQRNGRIIRQGNENKEVDIYSYVTESTFDAYLYQTVENKQKFISQIMTDKSPARTADDIDERALSFAEIKALCAGDPEIKEKMDLEVEVTKLRLVYSSWQSNRRDLERKIAETFPNDISRTAQRVECMKRDVKLAADTKSDKFVSMTVDGRSFAERKAAGEAFMNKLKEIKSSKDLIPVGEYRGFKMAVCFDSFKNKYTMSLKNAATYRVDLGKDASGNITRIDNVINSIEYKLEQNKSRLTDLKHQLKSAKADVNKPFDRLSELQEKEKRLAYLNKKLSVDATDKETPEKQEEKAVPFQGKKAPKQDFSL